MTTASITIAPAPTGSTAPAAAPVVAPAAAPAAVPTTTPTTPTTPVTEQRPAWLPTKFKDVEQLAAAYGELEKKLGGNQPDPAQNTQPVKPETQQPQPGTDQGVADVLKANGFDYSALQGEFSKNGKLSDESYGKLTAKFGKELVDNYFAGQSALSQAYETSVTSFAGGKDAYGNMINWAASNMTPEQKVAFNDAVNSGDTAKAEIAVRGLRAQYDAANGTDPNLMGGTNSLPASGGYTSWAQVTEDMKSPRYAKDPSFRAEVQQKLSRSNIGA